MEFVLFLAATVGGLLVGIVLVNAFVDLGGAICRIFRSRPPDEPTTRLVLRLGVASIRHRGPWVLAAAIALIVLAYEEALATGFLAGGLSWIAFSAAVYLLAVFGSHISAALSRRADGNAKDDDRA